MPKYALCRTTDGVPDQNTGHCCKCNTPIWKPDKLETGVVPICVPCLQKVVEKEATYEVQLQ